MLKGNIIAVDLFEEFLEKLKEDSKNENITAHIETLAASMDKLPFEKEEFDIIWCYRDCLHYRIGGKKRDQLLERVSQTGRNTTPVLLT